MSDPVTSRGVPLLDINRGNEPQQEAILEAVAEVCRSGRFLHGPPVRDLETEVAKLCDVKHAISCASGSDALLLSLMASGIGPGDEVIVPSFTFFATASAVWRLGAKIIFVDIEPATFNMDPALVEQHLTSATRAIIPVHLFGQCAPMDALLDIAHRHNVVVVEDAAQAIGARYHDQPAGSWGDTGCFSFYPTKNLGGYGDGGMITTNNDPLAERLRLYASHGMHPRYYHSVVGINSRMDTIQAAVLQVKLRELTQLTSQRQANAARYAEMFRDAGLDNLLGLPASLPAGEHVWNQYTVRIPHGQRDALRAHLSERKIGTEIYYPVPLHQQECFRELGYQDGSLPETEKASQEVLSLPIFPEMTADEQQIVVESIVDFCRAQRLSAA